ncbi:MAG: hypothetical protein DMG25_11325 [Acidobacteria bacterium]|nr:MAG: hypothetical protein DMG25_11325 [Acidobacteriota bacterium]
MRSGERRIRFTWNAELFRRSTTWVYRASDPDLPDPLPCIRLKRTLLYEVEDLRDWISRHKVESGDKLPDGDGNARDWRIRMSRKRYQAGFVRKRGKNVQTQYWEGTWREYVRGEAKPQRRSARLGLVREMSKGDAKHKLSELLHEVNSPDDQPESPITLDEFWRKFEQLVLPNRKYSTRRDMSHTYKLYIKSELGLRQMKSISRESLQLFFNRLLLKGELAYGTRMKVKMYLSSIFTHAVKYGYLTNNKVRSVDLGQKPPHTQPDLPTTEELRMIEEALPHGKYRMFFQTSMGMGARAGEVPALRWRFLDLEQGIVWIRQTVYDGKLDSPKTYRSAPQVYIPEELVQKLREYKKQFPNATDDDFVFPSQTGKTPIRYSNLLNRWLRPICKRLGITRTTWLSLRHWYGTELAENGVPLKTLQEQMGHASIATTMKYYVHAQEKSSREAARVIGRAMGQPAKSVEAEPNSANFDDITDDTGGDLVGARRGNR